MYDATVSILVQQTILILRDENRIIVINHKHFVDHTT